MYGLGLAKGLAVTLRNMLVPSRMFTQQYPDRRVGPLDLAKEANTNVFAYTLRQPRRAVRALMGLETLKVTLSQHPRFRGEEFIWYEERCTGCASCAKYCPLGIIRIVTSPSGEQQQEGEKYAIEVFDIDIGRCMFCGLCVEACPYDALHMGSGFEEATYRRRDLVIPVEKLRAAPKRPSTWFRPQMERAGYKPRTEGPRPWREAGRHQQPSPEELEERWARR